MQLSGSLIDKAYYLYYHLRPIIPRRIQIILRRKLILSKRSKCNDIWPIDRNAGESPEGWTGWPEKNQFAFVLTHDIETAVGQKNCQKLMKVEEELGFRSSFGFVPRRYDVDPALREDMSSKGFEVVVHGLYHDGKLYKSKKVFKERAVIINQYLKEWNAVGFRSPSMHSNLKWIHDFNIEYDSSTFDTDPFEPDCEGMGTIFPFFVTQNSGNDRYVEIPYTMPQDFTLFVLMKEMNIDIWKRKLDWIAEKGGLALLTTHPDYMKFGSKKPGLDQYPADYYRQLLSYISDRYKGRYWHVLPRDLSRFWYDNYGNKQGAK